MLLSDRPCKRSEHGDLPAWCSSLALVSAVSGSLVEDHAPSEPACWVTTTCVVVLSYGCWMVLSSTALVASG